MAQKVKIDGLADAVMKELTEYADLATVDMKAAVKKAGNTVKTNTAATVAAAGSIVLSVAASATLDGANVVNGTVDLTFTISGKTVVKKFAWAKSTRGSNGTSAVVFSVYAPNGTIVMNQSGSLSLATSAYSGTTAITSATYQWAKYTGGKWTNISGATSATLTVSGSDIVNIQSYRCTMTYGGKSYWYFLIECYFLP